MRMISIKNKRKNLVKEKVEFCLEKKYFMYAINLSLSNFSDIL